MGTLGSLSPEASVAVGIIMGLLSTTVQSIGLTLQRKSHILEDEKEEQILKRPPYRRRRWQLGMLMFVVANLVGSTIQITTLPLPVLSSLQASGLVFNSICATLILGEPFTRYSLIGTILVTAGAVLIAAFSALSEPSHNLSQLLELLGRRQFILWIFATAVVTFAILLGVWTLRLLHRPYSSPRMRLIRGMAYGCVSGILSAHSLLFAKSAVELLVRTIVDRVNQFNRWQSWIILLSLIALALSQLYYLHRGLKLCSTSVLYPFVFCVYNIIAILDGLIYFRQTSRLPPLHAVLIALGTVVLLTGVFALSWRLDDDSATKPAVAQTALMPGMGFVDDATEETNSLEQDGDEEATPGERTLGERTPLLQNGQPVSQTAQHKGVLSAMRLRRQTIAEEAHEIWDELKDQDRRYTIDGASRRASVATPVSRPSVSAAEDGEQLDKHRVGVRRSSTMGPRRGSRRRASTKVGSGSSQGSGKGTEHGVGVGNGISQWWKRRWRT